MWLLWYHREPVLYLFFIVLRFSGAILLEVQGLAHGVLDLQSLDVLPVFLKQRHQEIDNQEDIVGQLIILHLHVANNNSLTTPCTRRCGKSCTVFINRGGAGQPGDFWPSEGQCFSGTSGWSSLLTPSSWWASWGTSSTVMTRRPWLFPTWRQWRSLVRIRTSSKSWLRSMVPFWPLHLRSSRSHISGPSPEQGWQILSLLTK